MTFYLCLFLIFFYFKISRVQKNEEKISKYIKFRNIFIFITSVLLFISFYKTLALFSIIIFSVLFFILNEILITVIKLGIFVNGKPILTISKLYSTLNIISLIIILLTIFNYS